MISFNSISKQITLAGITPSVQRIKIMEYLYECQCHPPADQIYSNMKEQGSAISKATVYNTLNLFAEKGLIRVITMEGNENRFDIITYDHGHFICEKCGEIRDFDIDADKAVQMISDMLEGYKVRQKDIYFKGICSKCLLKE